jgi:hypothetical protein
MPNKHYESKNSFQFAFYNQLFGVFFQQKAINQKIEVLLKKITIEEKIGQINQYLLIVEELLSLLSKEVKKRQSKQEKFREKKLYIR